MTFQRSFGQGKQELARVANDSQHILSVAFPFFLSFKKCLQSVLPDEFMNRIFFWGGEVNHSQPF